MTDPALCKLALAVINTAVNDRHLAKRYLARRQAGQSHNAHVLTARRKEVIREATAFLVSPSIWHEILDIHPETMGRRLARPDFDQQYAAGKRRKTPNLQTCSDWLFVAKNHTKIPIHASILC